MRLVDHRRPRGWRAMSLSVQGGQFGSEALSSRWLDFARNETSQTTLLEIRP